MARRCLSLSLLGALALSWAPAASATVLWRGEFENGTRAEFSRYHAVQATPPRIDAVTKPTADGLNSRGSLAARIEVRTGDDARKLDPKTGVQIGNNDYNERAELQLPSPFPDHSYIRNGDELWITWQAMFPKDEWWGVDPKGGGTVFFQIHHVKLSADEYNGSPPLMFVADNSEIRVKQCTAYLCPSTVTRTTVPLKYDHWYTFVLHIVNANDADKGLLQVWIDGELKTDVKTALNFGPDFANYMLTGQYRRPNTIRNSVMYADNYLVATSQADLPQAIVAPPKPSPSPVPAPSPSPSPTPTPTPSPTPEPEPTPTPSPSPAPTPEPIPTPTPEPIPEPLPDDLPGMDPEPVEEDQGAGGEIPAPVTEQPQVQAAEGGCSQSGASLLGLMMGASLLLSRRAKRRS